MSSGEQQVDEQIEWRVVLTFISSDRGWPMPPAAPRTATFLSLPALVAISLEACMA
jgi:hypothetical protein